MIPGLSTLLRTLLGITINDVIIDKAILEQYLVLIPGLDTDQVKKLLNPEDPQDVPRAIALIQAVIDLRNLDASKFDASRQVTLRACQLLGSVLHSLTEPFINRNLSLSTQMTYLSQYAHLTTVLYRKNSTSFMPPQLFGDSNTTVKSAYFYLAKQLLLNPALPVLLMLCGDDRLENLFGRVRMQGKHNSGVDLATLMERLASAMDLCRIFAKHPSWDQGHRRLNYTRLEQYDHLRPGSFTGNLRADSCKPADTWAEGRRQAELILKDHKITVDFDAIFSNPDVDTLRPLPGGTYPGISPALDRSIEPEISVSSVTVSDECDDEEEGEENVLGISGIADLLDEPPAPQDLVQQAGEVFIEEGGFKIFIQTAIKEYFGKNFLKKSPDRCFRVKGFSTRFLQPTSEQDASLLGVPLFMVGDLFTTLIRTGETVALAVVQCATINQGPVKVLSVSVDELALKASNIKLSGQVYALAPRSVPDGSFDSELIWTGKFIKFHALNAKKDKATGTTIPSAADTASRNALSVSIPSWMTLPLAGTPLGADTLSDLDLLHIDEQGLTETWGFKVGDLKNLALALWELCSPTSFKITETGAIMSGVFPYAGGDGTLS